MYINQIRHATITITYREHKILVDPMFSPKETMLSLQTGKLLRLKKTNPLVNLPDNFIEALEGVTHVLITHDHFDHLDRAAVNYLRRENLDVYCSEDDAGALRKKGLKVIALKKGMNNDFLGGSIRIVEGRHGWGWIAKPMGHSVGYVINMPEEPSLYLAGDTVLTPEVRDVITGDKPEYIVLPSGKARLGVGKPLLMDEDEIMEVVELAHNKVILNHMEVMDHCEIDRMRMRELLEKNKLTYKAMIPHDGEEIRCD